VSAYATNLISITSRNTRRASKNPARFVHTIYQDDLEETYAFDREIERALRDGNVDRAQRAVKQRADLLRDIEAALRAGARVEEGAHIARLVSDRRSVRRRLKLEIC
jgi:hypothetical protein